jgi:hypothetical protein
MWLRTKQPGLKHRVTLQVSFDIEDKPSEAAAERVDKIISQWMPVDHDLLLWLTKDVSSLSI